MSAHLEMKRDRDMVDDKEDDEEELDPDDEDEVSGSDTTQLVALTTHVLENLPEQIRSTSELRDCVRGVRAWCSSAKRENLRSYPSKRITVSLPCIVEYHEILGYLNGSRFICCKKNRNR